MRSNMEDTPNSIMERTMESDPHTLYARVRNQEKIQDNSYDRAAHADKRARKIF